MSSTSAVGTPISVAHSVSSNVPSSPSVPPSYIPSSPSSGVNTVSLLTSVTTSPIPSTSVPVTTSGFSKQSQQSSSASQTTMTVTTVAATTAPTSASLSVPSSTVPPTSARVSSMSSSAPPAISVTSSNDNQSSTSIPESSVQPTTPSTAAAPTTTRSSTLTSSSLTTSLIPISAAPSTSNTPFTITSSPSPSNSSSQSSSLVRTDIPLTTVLESTTIFITSTNSQGQVMTSVPPVVTEVITTTGSSGIVTTVTQAIVNPTLAPNNSTTGGSSFFTDTGAVVGVFVVVGLASASIMMWILFAILRRQRMRRIEQDTAVEAAVAAAGLNRAPLDDDDGDDGSPISPNTHHQFSPGMDQRSSLLGLGGSDSLPTSARLSEVLDDPARDSANSPPGCPVEHRASSHPEGYVPARTTSPSPRAEQCIDDLGSSRDRKSSYGHTPTYSAGSFEPLLANYVQNMSDQDTSAPTMEPPRNRRLGSGLTPNGHSSDGSPGNGSRTSLKRQNTSDSSVLLRDEEDYTRYVLMVRNVPDDQSQHSL